LVSSWIWSSISDFCDAIALRIWVPLWVLSSVVYVLASQFTNAWIDSRASSVKNPIVPYVSKYHFAYAWEEDVFLLSLIPHNCQCRQPRNHWWHQGMLGSLLNNW
jgi:hypothetical protein